MRPTRLVVNADDFGYSRLINDGIVACANRGVVTATGIFGNAPAIDEAVRQLADAPGLDAGVHLALSTGAPLTRRMASQLQRWHGQFPGKAGMAWLITRGLVDSRALREELRAQLDACLQRQVKVWFINSHEHLHMHPRVMPIVEELAHEHRIQHVRITRPDLVRCWSVGGLIRNAAVYWLSRSIPENRGREFRLLGLSGSGRLTFESVENLLRSIPSAGNYELMCHPGYDDPVLATRRHLRAYHDWDGERLALSDPRLTDLLKGLGIGLCRFRELPPASTHEDSSTRSEA